MSVGDEQSVDVLIDDFRDVAAYCFGVAGCADEERAFHHHREQEMGALFDAIGADPSGVCCC